MHIMQTISYSRQMHGFRHAELRSKASLSLQLAHIILMVKPNDANVNCKRWLIPCLTMRINDGLKQSMHISSRMLSAMQTTVSTLSQTCKIHNVEARYKSLHGPMCTSTECNGNHLDARFILSRTNSKPVNHGTNGGVDLKLESTLDNRRLLSF